MSREGDEPVHLVFEAEAGAPRPTWEGRFAARMPWFANRLVAPVLRLPPRSRMRQWALIRMAGVTFSAINRRDLDVVAKATYAPDAELMFHGGAPADVGGDFHRGREAVFATYRHWVQGWEDLQRRPVKLIDLGDRLLVLVRETGRTRGGVELEQEAASLFTFRRGRVVRQDEYRRWADALEAIGWSGRDAPN